MKGALRDRWFDDSGGLGYHWRAWRHRRLWAPFLAQVGEWLAEWRPPCPTLVLVGPSAGYALSAGFLDRFTQLVALEPDPLARSLLRRRFAGRRWRFARLDVFDEADGPDALARAFPDAAILFCNVVGQALDAAAAEHWCARTRHLLAERHWASWHDVFSSTDPPGALPGEADARLAPEAAAEVARRLWAGQRCEIADHGTFGWLPDARHALWHLAPAQWQVIGWAVHRPWPGSQIPLAVIPAKAGIHHGRRGFPPSRE